MRTTYARSRPVASCAPKTSLRRVRRRVPSPKIAASSSWCVSTASGWTASMRSDGVQVRHDARSAHPEHGLVVDRRPAAPAKRLIEADGPVAVGQQHRGPVAVGAHPVGQGRECRRPTVRRPLRQRRKVQRNAVVGRAQAQHAEVRVVDRLRTRNAGPARPGVDGSRLSPRRRRIDRHLLRRRPRNGCAPSPGDAPAIRDAAHPRRAVLSVSSPATTSRSKRSIAATTGSGSNSRRSTISSVTPASR